MVVGPHEPTLHSLSPGAMLLMTMFLELEPFSASPVNFDLVLDDGAASMDDFRALHRGSVAPGHELPLRQARPSGQASWQRRVRTVCQCIQGAGSQRTSSRTSSRAALC
ncbi:hypothetical protein HPB48_017060 [Haemaphysalis longicornis]|uniref:Uncharacterized protein n=1 Tax=Haemaphysalis longicornis TaxID=44386 RepID=A0A9J6H4F0_HAELO|nr:hypothetical protein HPB48_017060 [Haemaphysalis longicornis]